MAKEAKDRQSELKRLVEQPQSASSKPERLSEQISGVQGASQTDLHKAFDHAQDMLKDHISQYEAAIDSLVKAAKHELNDSKAEQGWGGEDGGPGTEEDRGGGEAEVGAREDDEERGEGCWKCRFIHCRLTLTAFAINL